MIVATEDYQSADDMKVLYLKEKLARSQADIENGHIIDGETFFDDLVAGKHD